MVVVVVRWCCCESVVREKWNGKKRREVVKNGFEEMRSHVQ